MSCLVSTTTLKWCSSFRTITEGEGPAVDSTSIADMADFDDLFHSLTLKMIPTGGLVRPDQLNKKVHGFFSFYK